MAALKSDALGRAAKASPPDPSSPLARMMREFEELVKTFEEGLLRSLEDGEHKDHRPEHVHREACRLAISDLSSKYTPKYIHGDEHLGSLHNGYFRLYSSELFDLLGEPTDLRFGTLRFHKNSPPSPLPETSSPQSPWVTVELALNDSFFVADSMETLPYHTFRLPTTPSLRNCGILSRKPEDPGFPEFDSWLLFTFLGNGCIKLEVPIEMCADIYGGNLCGRENEEVLFWGIFVDDDE
ncbi:hypothetical protein A1F97_00089 [Pyrenophora tritici-repentis]|nr:hypothetical protein A1F96_00089 [Pyrenophora tritici-repentis]PZD47369.1 hypothetical protein A1F97_00089 [Pyrenophora tritici-repentis]